MFSNWIAQGLGKLYGILAWTLGSKQAEIFRAEVIRLRSGINRSINLISGMSKTVLLESSLTKILALSSGINRSIVLQSGITRTVTLKTQLKTEVVE